MKGLIISQAQEHRLHFISLLQEDNAEEARYMDRTRATIENTDISGALDPSTSNFSISNVVTDPRSLVYSLQVSVNCVLQ